MPPLQASLRNGADLESREMCAFTSRSPTAFWTSLRPGRVSLGTAHFSRSIEVAWGSQVRFHTCTDPRLTTKAVGCIARDESRDYSVDEPNGGTALMLAVDNGHHLAVEVLIAAGANVSASDTMG